MAIGKKTTQIMIRIMEKLLETEDMDESLAGSLELLVSATESQAGALWVLDEAGGRYYPMFFMGEADLTNQSIQNGEYTEGKTAADGQTRTLPGAAGETDGSAFETAGIRVRNMICVPLKNAGRTIGAMTVADKKEGRDYSADEMRLCEQMAAHPRGRSPTFGIETPFPSTYPGTSTTHSSGRLVIVPLFITLK